MASVFGSKHLHAVSLYRSMAWNQRCVHERLDPEERFRQVGTHFHDFAKPRLTQRTEFARGGRSWTVVPGVATYEGAATQPKGPIFPNVDARVAPSHKGTKKEVIARTVRSQTSTFTADPGAVAHHPSGASGWNYNACSTESTSSSRTWVKMGQLQQGASQQTTFSANRPRSTPLYATRMLWAAIAARNPQGFSYPRVTTPTPGWVACAAPAVKQHLGHSVSRGASQAKTHCPSFSLRCHILVHHRASRSTRTGKRIANTGTSGAAGHDAACSETVEDASSNSSDVRSSTTSGKVYHIHSSRTSCVVVTCFYCFHLSAPLHSHVFVTQNYQLKCETSQ